MYNCIHGSTNFGSHWQCYNYRAETFTEAVASVASMVATSLTVNHGH